jgi:hypothetical protein
MIDRLMNPYKRNILLKLKANYKGVWGNLYAIFEIYQFLIQLDEYLVLTIKDSSLYSSLEDKFNNFLMEFKRHYEIEEDIDPIYIRKLLRTIDATFKSSEIDHKVYIMKLGHNPGFIRTLNGVKNLIEFLFIVNRVPFVLIKRVSPNGFKYVDFKYNVKNIEIETTNEIKLQLEINNKLVEYHDLEKNKYIKENNLSLTIKKVNDDEYAVAIKPDGTVDSVYTADNKQHRTLELAVQHNIDKKVVGENYNKFSLKGDKLLFEDEVYGIVERVDNLEERINKYNKELAESNSFLKHYEEKENNNVELVSLSENEFTRQVSVVNIKDDRGLVRPVIVEGKFKGVYLDQIVSSIGHMLDTEFYMLHTDSQVIEKINSNSNLLNEPYIFLDNNDLVLHLPLKAVKEKQEVSKFTTPKNKNEFYIELEDYNKLGKHLGSVILSKTAKDYLFKYLQLKEKSTYLKVSDHLNDYSTFKIEGFKKDIPELTVNEKIALDWVENNINGIIGINKDIEKLVLALALKNPKKNYLLVSKEKGNLAKEIHTSCELFPMNLKEIVPSELKNANPTKYQYIIFNNVEGNIKHSSKFFFTEASIAKRIDKLYHLNKMVNNLSYTEKEKTAWCSKYSHKVVDTYVGLKKETKEEFLEWLRENCLILSKKDITLESAIGIKEEKQSDIQVTKIDPQIESLYIATSKEITTNIKNDNLDKKALANRIEILTLLLNNPKKALSILGKDIPNLSNPKINKAISIAKKNDGKTLFFTEDDDLAEENASLISKQIPGYHAYIQNGVLSIYENGYKIKDIPNTYKTLTASHYDLKTINTDDFSIFVHLDRGNYSTQVLSERSSIIGDKKEIYIDAISSNPTLDKVFSQLSLEQKEDIEKIFENHKPVYIKVNANQEALKINRDLLEACVSANPSLYPLINKRIVQGNRYPLINKSFLDEKRFEKLEKNNPHAVAKIRSVALKVQVPYQHLLDISCLSILHNPITLAGIKGSSVEVLSKDATYEIEVGQTHPMLGMHNTDTHNYLKRIIKVKNGMLVSVENDIFTSSACSPKGIGTKAIFTQYKAAIKYGLEDISTHAAGDFDSFDSKGKIKKEKLIGYYVWGKLGYNANILKNQALNNTQKKSILDSLEMPKWKPVKQWLLKYTEFNPENKILWLSDVYACNIEGKLLGQQWWKENGYGLYLSLDTDPASLSYRVINKYFKKKCEEEGLTPEEYLTKELPPFDVDSIDCWNNILANKEFLGVNDANIKEVANQYSNNLIKALIKESETYPYLPPLRKFLYNIYKTPNSIRKKTIFNAIPPPVLKSILKKLYNEETKHKSLNQTLTELFEDITKGNIKLSSEEPIYDDQFLLEIAEDPALDKEWMAIGLKIQSDSIKKEITEADPLLKNKVK